MHRVISSNSKSLFFLIGLYSSTLSSLSFPVVNASPVVVPANYIRRQVSPTTINSPLTTASVSPASVSFTDGGGTNYSAPSILWIAFAIVLGLPLAFAGVRLWRITSGCGIALALSVLVWAAFVNSTTGSSLAANPITSDLFLSLFVWGIFAVGFILGFLKWGVMIGVSLLGADAGVALGIMIVLLRPGLLVPIYAVNIVPMALLGVGGALWPIWQQRIAVIASTSTIGTFFIALAVDLIIHKQSGMSQGLRFLLDRNTVHLSATLTLGYHPTLSTIIIIGVAIALIPLLSFAQHKIWKEPFDRSPESLNEYKISVNGAPVLGPGDEGYIPPADKLESDLAANTAPQHTQLRFPSLIPSLPSKVSNEYITAQQVYRSQPPPPMQSLPGVGVGRRPFVGYWDSVANAAKRVSNRMSMGFGGGARRMSAMFGAAGKRVSQMSMPSVYSFDNRQPNNPNARFVPNRDETPSSVYDGVQMPQQTKPLRLPNRSGNMSNARAPPPTNGGYFQQQPQQYQSRAPPAASLRSGKGWYDGRAGNGGLSPIQSQPATPRTPSTAGQRMPPTPRSVGLPSTPRERMPSAPRTPPSRPLQQQQQQQQPPATGRTANRLKTTTRYNLL